MNDRPQHKLDRAVDHLHDQMVEIRRHLHAHPEASGQEYATSRYITEQLSAAGIRTRLGPDDRGVVADFPDRAGGNEVGILALRADIDALRIHDRKQVNYRSTSPGLMHACGHDAHAAVVFGALVALHEVQADGELDREIRIRGIFQPEEETCAGAKRMIEAGAIEGVEAILSMHVDPSRPVGCIGLRSGLLTASGDSMRVRIIGKGGHAARPHEASDPIAAAAQLINALYLFVPRAIDSQDAVVLTIGMIAGGDNSNVIPEQVELRGTLRTLDRKVRDETIQHIRRLAHGVAETSDVKIDVQFKHSADPLRNDAGLVDLLRRAARKVVGDDGVDEIFRPSMGSEDFAFYLEHAAGGMFRLGCVSPRRGGSPLHSPNFDVDEVALAIRAKVLAHAAMLWSNARRPAARQTDRQSADTGLTPPTTDLV